MKPLTQLLALVMAMLFPLLAISQQKFSKVKFYPPASAEARNNLLGSLDIDHFYSDGDALISTISEEAVTQLKKQHVTFEILVDDVAADFVKRSRKEDFFISDHVSTDRMGYETGCSSVNSIISTPAAFSAGSMGGYYTYAEMNTKMDNLVAAFPAIASKFLLGNSALGRPIYGIKISDNVANDETTEPGVLYTGLQHAREAITGTSLIFFMQFIAEKYSVDSRIQDLVDNRQIYIIPCMNPDGYEYNRQTNPSGGGLWRKSRRQITSTSFGVDLNRNYSVDWGNCAGATSACGTSSPSGETYWGPSAFSEPETRALRDFVTSKKIVIGMDQHCFGPYYSLPFGRPSLHTMSVPDQNFYSYVPALMGKFNCQRAGNSPQTVGYEVAGGLKDWLLLGNIGLGTKGKIYGMTSEAGGDDFWAPTSEILPLSKGLCFQNLQLAYAAGSYADLQDLDDVAVSAVSGNFDALIRRVGLGNDPVTVTLLPLENIAANGAPVTIASMPNYYDVSNAAISYDLAPGIGNGDRIKFAWKVETGGYTTYDTVTKFYNPLTILADNMEGSFATNWTATISPSGTGWNFTTGDEYEGTKSMTESPSGNYTAKSTRRATYKNALNLANATGAWLIFWVKHRAENCNDKLQIQVSTNGGTTFVPVCGRNTIQENDGTLAGKPALTGIRENWTKELVDLSAFRGYSNVRFRFEFTSNTDASSDDFYKKLDDGFYIDNLKIIKSTAFLSAEARTFVTIEGELQPDNSGLINWEAFTDAKHDHFVVEKSTNGVDFSEIGSVKGNPPYQFTDNDIAAGNNIYRVKEVNKDGTKVQSRSINLVSITPATIRMALYPNPATDILHLQLNSALQQSVKLQITDAQGRLVHDKVVTAQSGLQTITLSTKNLQPQLYFLYVRDSKNKILTVQKFIKE